MRLRLNIKKIIIAMIMICLLCIAGVIALFWASEENVSCSVSPEEAIVAAKAVLAKFGIKNIPSDHKWAISVNPGERKISKIFGDPYYEPWIDLESKIHSRISVGYGCRTKEVVSISSDIVNIGLANNTHNDSPETMVKAIKRKFDDILPPPPGYKFTGIYNYYGRWQILYSRTMNDIPYRFDSITIEVWKSKTTGQYEFRYRKEPVGVDAETTEIMPQSEAMVKADSYSRIRPGHASLFLSRLQLYPEGKRDDEETRLAVFRPVRFLTFPRKPLLAYLSNSARVAWVFYYDLYLDVKGKKVWVEVAVDAINGSLLSYTLMRGEYPELSNHNLVFQ